MEATAIRHANGAQPSDRRAVKRRMTWREVTPFPDNPIYKGRLQQLRRDWGGYVSENVGSPAICDNASNAFPDHPAETLFIVDGNHRYALAEEDGKLDDEFLADLHRGLSRAQIYKRRRGLNDRRTVKPAETFLERIEEGDRTKRAIKEAVEALAWAITHQRADGGLSCTNELEWIWARDQGALVRAIQTYESVWGRRADRSQASVLKGLGYFWIKYPEADAERLARSLSGITVEEVYRSGKNQKDNSIFTKTLYDGIRYSLAMGYNRRGRGGQLPL